jgi:hypothetical protein
VAALALAGLAAGQDGQPRSKFRPRADGPGHAALVLPVQAKTAPGPMPGTTPAPATPGQTRPDMSTPGAKPGANVPPLPGKAGTDPNTLPGQPGSVTPVPGKPGAPGTGGAGAGGSGLDVGGTGSGARVGQDPYEAYIRLEPPGKERLFGTRDTERELEERMRQERKDTGSPDTVVFPVAADLSTEPFQPRRLAPMTILAEPSYVVYQPLWFEEKNAERYGWDLGPVQPVVSTLCFFKDVFMWPHNCLAYPCRRFETDAGQCLPGDPVPYYLYPPELTGSGLLAEVAVIGLLVAAVP